MDATSTLGRACGLCNGMGRAFVMAFDGHLEDRPCPDCTNGPNSIRTIVSTYDHASQDLRIELKSNRHTRRRDAARSRKARR